MLNKYIIITTINSPSQGILEFSKLKDWKVVVVGDSKTPEGWKLDNVHYISVKDQECYNLDIPFNSYSRKLFGYLYAIQNGADIIAESDDDNIPMESWAGVAKSWYCRNYVRKGGFINVYRLFTNKLVWPRGLPLTDIYKGFEVCAGVFRRNVGVWQGLVDKDPDVDAIYRLVLNKEIIFQKNRSVVLDPGTLCSFNSQNTIFRKELFPLLYLPVTVPSRFSDILRGIIAQPLMWNEGFVLGFHSPDVYQDRNPHNLIDDFIEEIPCYTSIEDVYSVVKKSIKLSDSLITNLLSVYYNLAIKKIVRIKEYSYLKQWLTLVGDIS